MLFKKVTQALAESTEKQQEDALWSGFPTRLGAAPGAELSASHCYLSSPLRRSSSRRARPKLPGEVGNWREARGKANFSPRSNFFMKQGIHGTYLEELL